MSDAGANSNRGDDYQRAIALKWAVDMLADNDIVSMEVEVTSLGPGNTEVTVDDVVVRYQDETHYFQCKKNQPNWLEWKLSDKTMCDELCKAHRQLQVDTTGQVHFYSQSPFGALSSFSEYSEIRPDHASLTAGASKKNTATLKKLAELWEVSKAEVLTNWQRLKFITTESVDQIKRDARLRLQQLVNQPDSAVDFMTAYIVNQSGKRAGPRHRFARQDLLDYLHKRGIVRIPSMSEQEILDDFRRASAIHREWKRQVGTHRFPRSAVNEVLQHVEGGARTILIVDKPGSGKTCVLLDVVERLEQQESCGLLFIKGDYYADCPTPEAMVAKGLPDDVVGKVACLADYRRVVVVIDSLDVLSLNRQHGALGFFLGMLDQVGTIKNATCVVACREYDLSYDYHLSGRDWQIKVPIGLLDWNTEVLPVLIEWGVNADTCSDAMRQLLRNPRNLAIYERVAQAGNSRVFASEQDLLNIYLDEVVRRNPVLGEMAMSGLQAMAACLLRERGQWLPAGRIRMTYEIRRQLMSDGVLISGQSGEIGFGHQTLAEGLAVMAAMNDGRTFAEFILGQPSLPFIRPAVRAFFFALRAHDARRFRKEVRQALDDDRIAYHLKRLVAESLGEILPEMDDWTLIRHLYHAQEHLFDRFLWSTKSVEWLDFLVANWLPLIRSSSSQRGLNLVEMTGRWLKEKPAEVIRLWCDALNNGWVDAANARWGMVHGLEKLADWHVDGVAELMNALLVIPAVQERDFLGKSMSRWIDATDSGDDLLWQYITSGVTPEILQSYRLDRKLQCDPHIFCSKDFLQRRMQASTKLLDLALHTVEDWSKQKSSGSYSCHRRYDGFLNYTSWERRCSQNEGVVHPVDAVNSLMDALEVAILWHATNNSEWWCIREPQLRQTGEAAVLYFLLQAYRENPESNMNGIDQVLLDQELWRGSAFRDELPLVARAAYHYLDDDTRERHQQLLLHLFDDKANESDELPLWVIHAQCKWFARIPASLRSPEVQVVLQKGVRLFFVTPFEPSNLSSGGCVGAPIAAESIMAMSDGGLLALAGHYCGFDNYEEIGGHIIGGENQVEWQFSEAASNDPLRFLALLSRYRLSLSSGMRESIVLGVVKHMDVRSGRLRDDAWVPVNEPTLTELCHSLLNILEQTSLFWRGKNEMAKALAACAQVAELQEDAERIVFLLHDVLIAPAPSTRSVAAEAAIGLAKKLLEAELDWPDCLKPLLFRFAHDEHAAVRALILYELPFIQYKLPDLGWHLFDLATLNGEAGIWAAAERCLYYGYYRSFDKVRPYLDRMAAEALPESGEIWARVSTLSVLEEHIKLDAWLSLLKQQKNESIWKGAVQVFATNIVESKHREACMSGLYAALEVMPDSEEVLIQIGHAFSDKTAHSGLPVDLVTQYLTAKGLDAERNDLFHFMPWLSVLAQANPLQALEIAEVLAKMLEGKRGVFWEKEKLGCLLTAIFREAEDAEDEKLIDRAVALQDAFLSIGIYGIDEWLVAAEKN